MRAQNAPAKPPGDVRPREPIPEIAVLLQNVVDAQARLRSHEDELATARDDFRDALRAAHAAGVPFAVLGRLVGLSRQRVARIVGE